MARYGLGAAEPLLIHSIVKPVPTPQIVVVRYIGTSS